MYKKKKEVDIGGPFRGPVDNRDERKKKKEAYKGGPSRGPMDSRDERKKKEADKGGPSRGPTDNRDERMDFRKIMKDVELFGSAHMTWKERKEMENRKVVALGGKPPKKHRIPLSVARPMMKKQKEREQKMLEERLILGQFGAKHSGNAKRSAGKRKPEDRVLRASEGHFRNGVLDVKHLLHSTPSGDSGSHGFNKGKKKGGGKKNFKDGMW